MKEEKLLTWYTIALFFFGISASVFLGVHIYDLTHHYGIAPTQEMVPIEIPSDVIETKEDVDPLQAELDALTKIEDRKEWYERYRILFEEHPELFKNAKSIYDNYTEEEIYMMQRVIETETYGCDFEAKTHVASVILNRVEGDNNFPNDVMAVCTAPNQFVYGRKQISDDTRYALEYAYEIEDTTNGALYFNSMEPMDSWNGRERIFTDHVGHSFY